jgi:hypothetical protein
MSTNRYAKYIQQGQTVGTPDPRIPAALENTQAGTARTQVQTRGDAIDNRIKNRDLNRDLLSTKDAETMALMRQQSGGLDGVIQQLQTIAPIIDRFRTGPDRAAVVRSTIPEKDEGLWGVLTKNIKRAATGVTPTDIRDYQEIEKVSSKEVLEELAEQKGVPSDRDAMRVEMTALGPDKDQTVNARIIGDNILRGRMSQLKLDHYARWINKYGNLAAVGNGRTVDEAWREVENVGRRAYQRDPRIQRLSGARQPASPPVMDDEVAGYLKKYGGR